MSLEELFVKGCYYCAISNSIWYTYRAKIKTAIEEYDQHSIAVSLKRWRYIAG